MHGAPAHCNLNSQSQLYGMLKLLDNPMSTNFNSNQVSFELNCEFVFVDFRQEVQQAGCTALRTLTSNPARADQVL